MQKLESNEGQGDELRSMQCCRAAPCFRGVGVPFTHPTHKPTHPQASNPLTPAPAPTPTQPPLSQVVVTLAAVAYTALALTGGAVGGPGAIILGGGLALSTTAVGMQVLQDRGETGET